MREERHGSDPAEILLVEDNPGDVRLTQEAFEEGKIRNELHVVKDGVAALDFLHQRGEYADAPRPDIVLLDLNLPRKNGDEVLAAIRDDDDLHSLPVVVLTSSDAQEDVVRSYELQVNAYLTKPVDPAAFIETVQSFQEFWLSVVRFPPDDDAEG
ncbi:Response regulator receiver domain-containing protein [Halomicrobium zhouii]|uniref:Response regulator receiver domain-containing protein n=1 Tax=Halomicrobium zhouii TaxID=767519 RepID=A0A1I6M6P3_9EURY|nr:response regulator [Halomicrobium zhouii]SFS11293.1 Response regulator receiver domain-containing protein [Halomicrobium zhouii]